jgi:hypothetical protein
MALILTPVERIAKIVSAVLHPLVLPAIAFTFLVVADSTHDLLHQAIVEGVAIFFSAILVPAYIFFLKQQGLVDSADIIIRKQRINPLIMAVVSYFIEFDSRINVLLCDKYLADCVDYKLVESQHSHHRNQWPFSCTYISIWQRGVSVFFVNSTSRSVTINFETTYVCPSSSWCSDWGVHDRLTNSAIFQ